MIEREKRTIKKDDSINPAIEKLKIHFVCDECCLPVSLYGENIILSVNNDEFITHIFCDLHAEEFLDEK